MDFGLGFPPEVNINLQTALINTPTNAQLSLLHNN
jgi:hypothetical protein